MNKKILLLTCLLILMFPNVTYAEPSNDPIVGEPGHLDVASLPAETKQIAETMWDFFRKEGFSEASTAGILGNAYAESSMNPASVNHIGCIGLFQWCGGRKKSLEVMGEASGRSWSDVDLQLRMAKTEMSGSHSGFVKTGTKNAHKYTSSIGDYLPSPDIHTVDEFKALNSVNFSAMLFLAGWEIPEPNTDYGPKRANFGKSFYAFFKGRVVDGAPTQPEVPNSSDGQIDLNLVVSEKDLVGMPDLGQVPDISVEVPGASGLTASEQWKLAGLKSDLAVADDSNMVKFFRVLVPFVGVLIVVWALFLCVALIFDRANTVFGISLVRILTFGRMELSGFEGNQTYGSEKRFVGVSSVVGVVACGILLGILLISGALLEILFQINLLR